MTNKLRTIGLILGLCATSIAFAAPRVVDQVAAVVNNNVVLESKVKQMFNDIKASTPPQNLPDDAALRHQVIERLIVDNLILQQAARLKITVSDADVTRTIQQIAKENNLTVDELRGHLSSSGISYNSYRERIRTDMLIDETRMTEVRRRISITPQEVDSLASTLAKQPANNIEVNISHILLALPENPSKAQVTAATEKAQNIISQLRNGGNFARLAATYSNDEAALSGGSLGWQKVSELPTLFEGKVIQAQKGDIIGPIRSGVGFHILKVDNTRGETQQPITVLEVNARHILIKTNVLVTDDQAKNQLADMRQQIVNNQATFEELAKAFSEDPGSAEKGGELGWNMPERYDEAFRNALLKLKKGEISQPIKSAFGWHLIQLLDTRKEDRTDLAQKEKAYRLIFNRKFSEELQIWIQELRADAYVKIIGEDNE
ncbi:peptidylprolyl isomerase SurA [Zophobihabitans entericus]|uniref:Chaperone SurA n=1 Tax=Zophobihabitans entericus TaxID=1635327 RepID=A0A6G9IBP2_9GAMM|nr:peptidylprolyl isomerase SurA [Zophobihabitans entericus]QIQ21655.1 peptidylprolyl isomerase SurA [Zophobihabitans entericus]